VLKESVADQIIQAVRTVAGGGDYLSPSMAGLLMKRSRRSQALTETHQGIGSLAASEKRVLRLIASDRTSKEIAQELGLSVRTVENHRARICAKLGLQGAHSLVKFAFEHKDEL
jgi:two-component system, NarL family, response regulator DegU